MAVCTSRRVIMLLVLWVFVSALLALLSRISSFNSSYSEYYVGDDDDDWKLENRHVAVFFPATLGHADIETREAWEKLDKIDESRAAALKNHVDEWHLCKQVRCSRSQSCVDGVGSVVCCSTILFDMLLNVVNLIISQHGVYSLFYGTLLGAVRDHKIIAWTADIDIVIPVQVMYILEEQRISLADNGYMYFVDGRASGVGRVCVHPDNDKFHSRTETVEDMDMGLFIEEFPYMDVYTGRVSDSSDEFWTELYGRDLPCPRSDSACVELPLDMLFPLAPLCSIEGRPFYCPHRPRKVLVNMYGMDYMTPKREHFNDQLTAS